MSTLFDATTNLRTILDKINALPEASSTPIYGLFDSDSKILESWDTFNENTQVSLQNDYTVTNRIVDETESVHLSKALENYFENPVECNIKPVTRDIRIGNNACYGVNALFAMTVPLGVQSIGNSAFEYSGLKAVKLPHSCTEIQKNAFRHTNLKRIMFDGTIEQWNAINKAFYWNYGIGKCQVQCLDGNLIESNFCADDLKYTSQGDGTCYVEARGACLDRDFIFPTENPDTGETVLRIAIQSFFEDPNVTSIFIPHTVERIGTSAFQKCISLSSVTFEENSIFSEIGELAFGGCTALTDITLPATVTKIGYQAFNNCTSLNSITVLATTPPTIREDSLNGVPAKCAIYVPKGYVSTYKKATNWSARADYIKAIPEEV